MTFICHCVHVDGKVFPDPYHHCPNGHTRGAVTEQQWLGNTVTAPAPLGATLAEGVSYGYTPREVLDLPATEPMFTSLVKAAVRRQVEHEEAQVRAWLQAVIDDPAGRKIIEEML